MTPEQKAAIEATRYAVQNPDIAHTPAMMRAIVRDLLAIIQPENTAQQEKEPT